MVVSDRDFWVYRAVGAGVELELLKGAVGDPFGKFDLVKGLYDAIGLEP